MNDRATGEIFADLLENPEQEISQNMIIVARSLSGWVTAKKIELTSDCNIEEGVKLSKAQIKEFSMCSIIMSILLELRCKIRRVMRSKYCLPFQRAG